MLWKYINLMMKLKKFIYFNYLSSTNCANSENS